MEDQFPDVFRRVFFDVEPAEKRFFSKPGKLPFCVLARGPFELGNKGEVVGICLGAIEKFQSLPISDRLRGCGVEANASLIETFYFFKKARAEHLFTAVFDPRIEALSWIVDKPTPKIILLFDELILFGKIAHFLL